MGRSSRGRQVGKGEGGEYFDRQEKRTTWQIDHPEKRISTIRMTTINQVSEGLFREATDYYFRLKNSESDVSLRQERKSDSRAKWNIQGASSGVSNYEMMPG